MLNSIFIKYCYCTRKHTVMARQTLPLNASKIDKAKPKDKLYRLYDGGGLVLNVTPFGGKYWYLQYKHPLTGKAQMYKLGNYPAVSLAEARNKTQVCHALLANHIDPKSHYDEQRQQHIEIEQDTFKLLFDEWLSIKKYAPKTQLKLQGYQREIIAIIGDKPVSQITVPDLMCVLKPIEQAGQYAKLEKMRSMIRQTLSYAIAVGKATQNPAIYLQGAFSSGSVRHNPAILDENRLADLVQAIYSYHGHFATKKALMFALLTFARPGEVRHLTWEQIDFGEKLWRYTPSKTQKSTKIQMVTPLSEQSMQILHELKAYKQAELVFPSAVSGHRPLSENTLNQALRRMDFASSEQTSHGFRAIARTLLEEKLGYDYRMIEMQLGHQVRDANGRAYNRVQWLDKRREMMQAWADHLDSLKK